MQKEELSDSDLQVVCRYRFSSAQTARALSNTAPLALSCLAFLNSTTAKSHVDLGSAQEYDKVAAWQWAVGADPVTSVMQADCTSGSPTVLVHPRLSGK